MGFTEPISNKVFQDRKLMLLQPLKPTKLRLPDTFCLPTSRSVKWRDLARSVKYGLDLVGALEAVPMALALVGGDKDAECEDDE